MVVDDVGNSVAITYLNYCNFDTRV